MSRVAPDVEWWRRAGALTAEPQGDWREQWPAEQLRTAEELATRLVACAVALVAANDCAGDAHHDCLLAELPAGTLGCDLAAELARHARPLATVSAPPAASPQQTAAAYLDALRAACGAVYFCRRVAHASGHCLFSCDGPGIDVCGRLLAAAHRLTVS